MNALEKVEKQEEQIKALAERVVEIHDVLQRILPVVDGIVEAVGRDKVLENASKIIELQRNTHVAAILSEYESRAKAGEYVESDAATDESILFVSERPVGKSDSSMRVLPVKALNDDVRKTVVGIKVSELVDPAMANGIEIKVERIFTPTHA